MTAPEKVAALIDSFYNDPNATRIKKLLFCTCHDSWPTDPQALEKYSWFDLLQELLERATDLDRLQNALIVVVSHLNKKNAYFILARSLFNRLKILYPDYRDDITSMGDRFAQVRQLFDNSQDLFSLRLRVSHHSSLSKAKSIVFSAISCRFDYTTQDVNYLNQQDFDDLVRELLFACNSIEDLRFRVFGAASCLDDRENNLKVATLLCGTIASFYPALHQQQSSEFLAGNASLDDFDRITAANAAMLDLEAYTGYDLDDMTVSVGPLSQNLPDPPITSSSLGWINPSAIVTQWPNDDTISPGVSSDIKNYADRQLHTTIANLENNLQAVSDYIDAHVTTPSDRTHAYKYQILRELVEGLQASCATQLTRLAQLETGDVLPHQPEIIDPNQP
ncbi:MAG: hypothetical protein HC795_04805 [Coleofasciculaceae cyanobacterium RL_1_1]|nr:hypothetical protein [Coleofasciculaceae cyanobacterium RL_1_1]